MSNPIFVGTCVELRARDLEAYDDTERTIGYARFRHYVGRAVIDEIESMLGYKPGPLTLKKDWAVSFGIGKWKGARAVCMHHSSIHHIWLVSAGTGDRRRRRQKQLDHAN